jgi:hypothetical protein
MDEQVFPEGIRLRLVSKNICSKRCKVDCFRKLHMLPMLLHCFRNCFLSQEFHSQSTTFYASFPLLFPRLFVLFIDVQIEVEEFGHVDLLWIVHVRHVDGPPLRHNKTFSSTTLEVDILDRQTPP